MDYHVMEARHVSGHRIWLRCRDGSEGVVLAGPTGTEDASLDGASGHPATPAQNR